MRTKHKRDGNHKRERCKPWKYDRNNPTSGMEGGGFRHRQYNYRPNK